MNIRRGYYLLFGFFLFARLLGRPLIGDVQEDQNHGEESEDVEQQLHNLVPLVRGHLVGHGSSPCCCRASGQGGLQKPSGSIAIREWFPFRCKVRVIPITGDKLSKPSHSLCQELRDQMVAQLPLVPHHPEIVIVAGAKHAIGDDLILSFSAVDDPDFSAARFELELADLALLDKSLRLLEPFLKGPFQNALQLVIHAAGPA